MFTSLTSYDAFEIIIFVSLSTSQQRPPSTVRTAPVREVLQRDKASTESCDAKSGRAVSECEQTGVTVMQRTAGSIIGPPADIE